MNCRDCRDWIDDSLLHDPDDTPPPDIARHLAGCEECARERELALETLEAITPRARVAVVPRLKARILAAIPEAAPLDATAGPPLSIGRRHRRSARSILAVAIAAAVLLAMTLFPIGGVLTPSSKRSALDLLSMTSAAEAGLFAADRVVNLVSEIVAEPVADPELAEFRWVPLLVVGADGKTRFTQLKLGGDARERYTIRDESWYDPATHRFAHVLSLGGRPLFANSYDGRSVHLLELDERGQARFKDEPVVPGFQPPKDPAEFLGLLAVARPASAKERIADRPDMVRDDGPIKLADGTPAHVLRLTFGESDSGIGLDTYSRLTIRDDNHRVESLESVASGKKLYTIRRVAAAGPRELPYGWDLAGLRPAVEKEKGGPRLPVQTLADMIRFDVSVDEMVKRADYPVYILGRDPSWSARRQIVDVLDVASPPHRMFAAAYPAKDRRHVVLLQAHSLNAGMGPEARASKLLYTSPSGIKVLSGKDDKAIARILLSSLGSSKQIFTDTTSKDCTGYLLETPEGTFPALAVNGVLTDAELHGLVDSLVRVKAK